MADNASPPALLRRWRGLSRAGFLLLTLALVWPGRGEDWQWTSVLVPALSPLVALSAPAAARSIGLLTLLALPILVLTWWIPRVVCIYLCPVGFLQEGVARLRGVRRRSWRELPAIGTWLALATLAGAALGYPLFLWLDPFALFHSGLNAWHLPLTAASLATGMGLPALLALEFLWPQLWCRRLCPLGATQDLTSRLRRWLRRGREPRASHREPLTAHGRRTFLAACGGAAGAIACRAATNRTPPLRPPGALAEEHFTGVCMRCGNCAQACPTHVIQPDLAGGPTGWLAPRLHFSAGFCREDCHHCQVVCPSGAITRQSLAQKRRAVIGSAQVDLETCLMAQGRECNACVQHCPYEAIGIASSPDGFGSRPQIDLTRCNGCGACEVICPVTPQRAVRVRATAQRFVLSS